MSIHVYYKARHRRSPKAATLHRIDADTDNHADAIAAVKEELAKEKRLRVVSPVLAVIAGA